MVKLNKEQVVTIHVLHEKEVPNTETAEKLGVTEGTVRYHLKREAEGATDGRRKPSTIGKMGLDRAVAEWWAHQESILVGKRPPSVQALHAWLQVEHGYPASYKSVRKYVRATFPKPKKRPFRRVETPPGAQAQTDWGEYRSVDIGGPDGPETLYAFVMTLGHSRAEAIIWSRSMDQLAWHRCHNEAFKRLGGVPATNRIDNLKTGMGHGAGSWGQVNAQYASYAGAMGFHVDACEPGCPRSKGKTERRVGVSRGLGVQDLHFDSLEHLQEWTDARVLASAKRRICPATGESVLASWEAEKAFLRPLPALLPEPFDVVVRRPVHEDCMVRFENRQYSVPFAYEGEQVEVRGCSGRVQIVDEKTGEVIQEHARHTRERILIDSSCYEGPSTERHIAPKPLGRMGQRLQELAAEPVQKRAVELYAALAEVAR